jgi:hypothetical protein
MVDSRIRIAGAFMIGGALVVSAFLMAEQKQTQQKGEILAATVVRSHIQIEDENGDGIPDWRDSLQKTEPIMLDSATSTYEKPTTITGKFAVKFLEDMFRSKMYGAFGDSHEELIAEATESLVSESKDVLFEKEDLTLIDDASPEIVRAYGNHIASIALGAKGGGENEAIILQDSLRYNDPDRLRDLDPIVASYVDLVKRMLETPVPVEYTKEHLAVLNAYNAIKEDVSAMQKVYEDALYTLIRAKRYEDDALGMKNALSQILSVISTKENITWSEGESAAQLVKVLEPYE